MKNLLYTFLVALFLFSCSDSLLEEDPPNVIFSAGLYSDVEGFEAGINGLNSLMRYEREGLNASSSLLTDITMAGTDVLVANHSGNGLSSISRNWTASNIPTSGYYENVFLWFYQIVNSANEIIWNAEQREDINWASNGKPAAENENYILAEARFARAFAYRHLSYLWGDVPLTLEPSSGGVIRTDWERTPVQQVREQVIADLLFAEQYIPEEAGLIGRPTKGAVQHYLAEMYLAMGQSDKALEWANKVVNNPAYALITERYGAYTDQPGVAFMDMFKDGNTNREEGNTEALWVFQFKKNTLGGGVHPIMAMHHLSRYRSGSLDLTVTRERGGYGNGRISLTKWALDNFDDPNDDRFSEYAIRKFFILKDEVANAPFAADPLPEGMSYGDTIFLDWTEDITDERNGVEEWPFSRKYDWGDPIDPVSNRQSFYDQVYLRAADTYLLKAEAEFNLGDLEAAAATINHLRRRAHAREITAADIDIDFILDERARELMVEGPRRYSLLRTGRWAERTQMYNHRGSETIDPSRDILLPIPQSVIDANLTQRMEQNPGF